MLEKQTPSFPLFQILDVEGNCDCLHEFDRGLLLHMYQWMLRSREYDIRLLKMQRQGRIGTYAPFKGQEAAQIGSAFPLEKQDWIFPSYRDIAACMVHGMPLSQVLKFVKGYFEGGKSPDGIPIFPIQIIIAAQTLHAAGCALAAKLKGEKSVSVCYFGDGATSQGDFHEALNFASVYKAPVVFFCQNNQWAISVPLARQMASETIAQKAVAYGIKGVRVDGNDVLAVYQVMKEAVESARRGEGPVLIEAVTCRIGPHTTSDDPAKYRNQKEVEAFAMQKDPLTRMKKLIFKEGLWTEEEEQQFLKQANSEMTAIVAEIEKTNPTSPDETFNHVYASPGALLAEQQQDLKHLLKQKGAFRQ
ncbi:pyruvate dehydrogenase (acetyl-transferring) E1 component subunit alpha [Heyndrickxia acidiproducens]|uniref:pyruvate dehydrogenase (acetyl-transferring) E1 component subunit alpha n=1 Tax=Heyndrickxia acidiproducens TaxID=1121084 RepID=UPI0003653881|nr:pyruvate dehydrogenase (acetyl-transferring) E1 component subunit alpha [Heyndrickxia acidiproducens]